jgi:PBP1b-binding outer membrane lipoprotein LpoB
MLKRILLLLPFLLVACTRQPQPEPTVSPFITKPINKTQDTKTDVEQKANDRSKLDPEKQGN